MSRLQIIAVAITIGLNALDGFDVLSISFASPGIAGEWGIDRAALGIVLSMELIGMAIGSIVLGGVADKLGRRPTMLACLTIMTAGMFMATSVKGIVDLCAWRLFTGFGIGGLLAAINAVAAEYSNARRRNLCVALMAGGYPVGAVVGGLIVVQLLKVHDWRSVFYLGAFLTACFIPLVWFCVPESVHWLAQKQPAGALEKISRTLRRMGHAAITALPDIAHDVRRRSIGDIFAPGLVLITVLATAGYFFHIITFYFILKWVPKIVVDMGFAPSSAGSVLVWANVGGITGSVVLALLSQRIGVKPLVIVVLLASTVMVTIFGHSPPNLQTLSFLCLVAGFFTNAGVVGIYAILAQAFPTHVRAFGTGFAIGVGRGGSALAPIVAGFLFKAGYSLPTVATIMACGSLLAAVAFMMLKIRPDQPIVAGSQSQNALNGKPAAT